MKIALVVERFEPSPGGVEQVVWQVARALVEAGDTVCVLARRARSMPGVRLVALEVPAVWQPWRVLAFSRAAAAATRAGRHDLVHSFTRTRWQDVYRAGGGSHADYLERSHHGIALALRRLSPRHVTLLALERAVFADSRQFVQCNSAMVRDEIARRHGVPESRLVVIHNGVDLARFRPATHGSRPVPTFLLVGSGFHRKGVDVALRALAASRSSRSVLAVVGRDDPGAMRALATRLGVAGRVRFEPPRPAVESLYATADALLLPTRYDAFANVTLEAMASGIPAVTSAANGAAEIVDAGGIVIDDPEDVNGFARALDVLDDPRERARLGVAARSIAERFSWPAHVERLRALYARVVRERERA